MRCIQNICCELYKFNMIRIMIFSVNRAIYSYARTSHLKHLKVNYNSRITRQDVLTNAFWD